MPETTEEERESEDAKNDFQFRGDWTVERNETTFGDSLKHGLSNRVIFMGLRKTAGWEPFGTMKLPGQTYTKHVHEWLEEHPYAREVAVLEVDTGTWQTVWARHNHDPDEERMEKSC